MGHATRARLNIERCVVLWIVMSLAGEITGFYYTCLSVNVEVIRLTQLFRE